MPSHNIRWVKSVNGLTDKMLERIVAENLLQPPYSTETTNDNNSIHITFMSIVIL